MPRRKKNYIVEDVTADDIKIIATELGITTRTVQYVLRGEKPDNHEVISFAEALVAGRKQTVNNFLNQEKIWK